MPTPKKPAAKRSRSKQIVFENRDVRVEVKGGAITVTRKLSGTKVFIYNQKGLIIEVPHDCEMVPNDVVQGRTSVRVQMR